MAAIYLIRHGQASFWKADYDQLSHKGTEQSELLGKYWQSLPSPEKKRSCRRLSLLFLAALRTRVSETHPK